jgi:small subunit ribosomal protein S17
MQAGKTMVETSTATRPEGRKTFVGIVHSNKMNKTIVVTVERLVKHAQYGKYIKRTTKLYAHDEGNQAGIGDKVLVMSTRPLSKTKRWRLIEVLERAK